MEIETWWQRLGCIRNPGAHSGEESARDDEIAELRGAIESREQEVLKLHRDLAAEKLRADQGWHRYEAANLRKNELEAERANWAQEIAALKAAASCNMDAWTDMRHDVLTGIDGLDNDQVNIVLGIIDQYMPDLQPSIQNQEETVERPAYEALQKECNSYKRMFESACVDLGLISEELGLDPNDGGAEPIIDAIKELQAPTQAIQRDTIRELIALHAQELDQNDYAYFELARTRRTDWMAWICTNLVDNDPSRKVLATGQGSTPEEACSNAIMDYAERAKDQPK